VQGVLLLTTIALLALRRNRAARATDPTAGGASVAGDVAAGEPATVAPAGAVTGEP
jgi:hypothetical protein